MGNVYWPGAWAVVLLYAAFLAVGWRASRKSRSGTVSDLILAGRAMPFWVATLTMTATWVDGGYLLGTAEGTMTSLASGIQGGLFFGLSLIVGGLFFARRMRRLEFTTLIDPFEARFGRGWAAILFLPALLGEVIWSAELLVAIGSTLGIILGMELTHSILLSAGVVTCYTMIGGMWSVAYTDVVQLGLIPLGLVAAMPFALDKIGGWEACSQQYAREKGEAASFLPPWRATAGYWTAPTIVSWWELSLLLMLGGVPWNCYFQRVLSCQTPTKAQWHSIVAGVLTISLVIPPVVLGMAASTYGWPATEADLLGREPALALPLLLRTMTPAAIAILGLGAIVGAVTSSFSSSILSAGSMLSWNFYRGLLAPEASVGQMKRVIRGAILVLGVAAATLALRVESVQKLWFFSADLVFVLLFPQLVMALFDPRANRTGSIAAFVVSLALRLGGGEPAVGLPAVIPYPELFAGLLPGSPADWYEAHTGEMLFPFKLLAAVAGVVLLLVVSRLSAHWDPPRALRKL